MAKRRKYKRTARRGGRVMTVTTSSRVVKTTRMNPRGLSLEPYRRLFKFGRDRHSESVHHTHSKAHLRKMMRELFPSWSKDDHAQQIIKLGRMIHVTGALWGRFANQAHAEVFPGKKRGFLDYKVSGVGREEYPERLKVRLRIAARQENTILSAIFAHEVMAGKAALRRAGIDDIAMAAYHGRSNPRPSKTHIEFVIQGNYGYGWDDENTELTREDAKRSLREYRENGQGSYRLIRRRVKNDATNPARMAGAPRNFYEAERTLDGRSSVKMGNNTFLERRGNDAVAVRLHKTDILVFHSDGYVSMHTGGYRTRTTADRLRSFGVPLYVERGQWWIRTSNVPGLGGSIEKPFEEGERLREEWLMRSNPHDPRTAETVRIPSVIRATLPASSGDPRRAETRRLRVVRVAAARSNPARLALRLSRATWRRLPKGDRRTRGSVRFVRCKTSKRGAAHWLRCVVR